MILTHLNIGSNLGDSTAYISRAVTLIGNYGEIVSVSAEVESEPWGYESSNGFLNRGVNLLTPLSPAQLIEAIQSIEREIDPAGRHRDSGGGYVDRRIDIDLIAYGNEIIDSGDGKVRVPHPLMSEREFVLEPMAEIWPDWHHPVSGLTPNQMLRALKCNKAPQISVK